MLEPPRPRKGEGAPTALYAGLLAAALLFTWLAMGPCLENGFVNWDETEYITRNPKIKSLTARSVAGMFASSDLGMYSPLTALSYALDYGASGLEPRRYHSTSLALHLANTALVFLLAALLLGGAWPPFAVALLFGVHPAHVESVAWAAERKDVLYAFFYLASLCLYILRRGRQSVYALSLLSFLCALLSKPMAVTLPLVLLLADHLKGAPFSLKSLGEKAPYFVLAAVFAAVHLAPSGAAPAWHWPGRVLTPLYNLGFYLYTLLWPFELSAMYVTPPGGKAGLYALSAAAALLALLAARFLRRDRELLFGAAFFAVTLLPVLQFFPFGPVISADRYTYISSIGIFLVAAAAASRAWAAAGPRPRWFLALAGLGAVVLLTALARARCAVWKDGETLWSDTVARQPAAAPAHVNLCGAYLEAGRKSEARECLQLAVRRFPGDKSGYYNLGYLEASEGEYRKAEALFAAVLGLEPCYAPALNNLGNIAVIRGRPAEAAVFYTRAAGCDAAYAPAYLNLGRLALSRGDGRAADEFFGRARSADPSIAVPGAGAPR